MIDAIYIHLGVLMITYYYICVSIYMILPGVCLDTIEALPNQSLPSFRTEKTTTKDNHVVEDWISR